MYSNIVGKKSSPCPRAYSSISPCIATSCGGKFDVSTLAIGFVQQVGRTILSVSIPDSGRTGLSVLLVTPPLPHRIATASTRESRHTVGASRVPFASVQGESPRLHLAL